jgi:hypothetical protein
LVGLSITPPRWGAGGPHSIIEELRGINEDTTIDSPDDLALYYSHSETQYFTKPVR